MAAQSTKTNPTNRAQRVSSIHGLALWLFHEKSFDKELIEQRNRDWMGSLNPQGGKVETFEVEQAVRMSFRLERCEAAQMSLIFAAVTAKYEGAEDESEQMIDARNTPSDQIKLLMRYEMHSDRLLSRLMKDLRERARIAKEEGIQPQSNIERNEPNPAPPAPQTTSNIERNEPNSAPQTIEEQVAETLANPLRPRRTDVHPPVDSEYEASVSRMTARYGPKDCSR